MFKNLYLNKQIACCEAQLGQSFTFFQEQMLGFGEFWEENDKEVSTVKQMALLPATNPSMSLVGFWFLV